MSKRKGPFLITDLASKLKAAPAPTRSTKSAADTDYARNAYGFIAENYKNTPSEPETTSSVTSDLSAAKKQLTNRVQTDYKVEPNLGQSEAKHRPQPESKLSQSEVKVEPASERLDHPPVKRQPKVEPQLRPQPESKLSQSEVKVEPASAFSSLVGLQRDALRYVFESCRFQGSKVSGPIVIQTLAASLNSTSAAVRKAVQRLEQKGCLKRATYKDGRGGWTEYRIPDDIYNALLLDESRAKLEPNLSQSRAKPEPQLEPQLRPRGSSSSSFLDSENLKTTTTGESELFDDGRVQLSPDWAAVDYSTLAGVGFSRAHLIQLAKHGKLSTAEVQDSIHFFAFDLKRNGKGREIKGPPVNFFMGILRKGLPYAPPENYESPETQARRRYLEGKRHLEEQRTAEERELEDLEFSEWRRGLSREEINAIVPDVVRFVPKAEEASLKSHFHDSVWPLRRTTIPGAVEHEHAEIGRQIDESLEQGSA